MTPTIFRNEINFLETESYNVSVWADNITGGTDVILTIESKDGSDEKFEERFNVVNNILGRKPIERICEVLHERNFEEVENAIYDKFVHQGFIDDFNHWLI